MNNRTRHATNNQLLTDEELGEMSMIEVDSLRPIRHRGEWTTGTTSYESVHARIAYLYGPATDHRCFDCGKDARHWSLNDYEGAQFDERIRCPWSPDLSKYVPRCVHCHRRHDQPLRRGTK